MSDQPPKTGTARRLWELTDEEIAEHFEEEGAR